MKCLELPYLARKLTRKTVGKFNPLPPPKKKKKYFLDIFGENPPKSA
jgi:hypothetical protein